MKTNYVLIDFENVQPESLEPLNHDHFKVIVFVGAKQGKLLFEVVESIQPLGSRAEYIRISGNGSNALDFHIAYYIGRFAIENPSAYFHIISKDTGFDPLIQHLKLKNILAGRVESVSDMLRARAIPATPKPKAKPATKKTVTPTDANFLKVVTNLKQRGKSLPGKLKALRNTIKDLFKKEGLSEAQLDTLVNQLKSTGKIKVDGTKLTYHL